MHSAGRVLKETGAQAVKLEGGYPAMVETITRLVQAGIPVMGHVGLTPQSVHQLGLRQQGKTQEAGERILNEAIALEQAGVFCDSFRTYSRKISIANYSKTPYSHHWHWCRF